MPQWDLFDPPEDPFPLYRRLRDHAPVYHNTERDFWALSRFDDVQAANRDWRTFSYARGVDIDGVGQLFHPGNFLDADPPTHTALRGVVKDYFRVSALREAFEPIVRDEVESLLAGIDEDDCFDVGLDFAWHLPIRASAHLLGFPSEDCARLRRIGDSALMVPVRPPMPPSVADGARTLRSYFEEQIQERRRHPRDDMLTRIACAEVDGRPIGGAGAGIATIIFAGAVDTTALTLTSAVYWLARHPGQRALLVEDPSRIPEAIEELLRFDGPIQAFRRTATTDVELHGTTIPAGANVVLAYGSANRDERRFERADEFDVTREPSRHLAFGDGIHHCIGAPLARIEAQIALGTLLERLPEYEVIDGRRTHGLFRGFHELRIKRG